MIGNRLLKNEYFFSILTKGFMVVIGLLESVLLARYLGADLRGELSYVYSIASTGYLIITFGIYTVYPFKRKQCNDDRDVMNLMSEFMAQALTLFVLYFAVSIFLCIISIMRVPGVAYVCIMLPVLGLDKIFTFVYLIEHPNRANFFTVISNCVQCIFLAVAFFMLPQNVLWGIVYYVIGCALRIVYYFRKLNVKYDATKFKPAILFKYIKFGFFPMVALLLTTLNYRLDVIMLKQYDSITLANIGIYSIGIGLSEKALLIPDTIKSVLMSKLAKGKGAEEVAKVMRICFLASILTAIVIMILGKFVVDLLYGAEYNGAEEITYITIWGTTVMVFFQMVSQYNVVQHKQHLNVIFLGLAIVLNFVFNLILIPGYGIVGAAIATIIGHLASSMLFLIYFHRISRISIYKMVLVQKEDILAAVKLLR